MEQTEHERGGNPSSLRSQARSFREWHWVHFRGEQTEGGSRQSPESTLCVLCVLLFPFLCLEQHREYRELLATCEDITTREKSGERHTPMIQAFTCSANASGLRSGCKHSKALEDRQKTQTDDVKWWSLRQTGLYEFYRDTFKFQPTKQIVSIGWIPQRGRNEDF